MTSKILDAAHSKEIVMGDSPEIFNPWDYNTLIHRILQINNQIESDAIKYHRYLYSSSEALSTVGFSSQVKHHTELVAQSPPQEKKQKHDTGYQQIQQDLEIFQELLDHYQQLELVCANAHITDLAIKCGLNLEHYTIYMLCTLCLNHLTLSRHLWKRIPTSMKEESPILCSLYDIVKFLWTKETKQAYEILHSIPWPPSIQPFIYALEASIEISTKRLIENAYSALTLEDASRVLGCNQEEIIDKCKKFGWNFNQLTKMVVPVMKNQDAQRKEVDIGHLNQLTNYISILEKQSLVL